MADSPFERLREIKEKPEETRSSDSITNYLERQAYVRKIEKGDSIFYRITPRGKEVLHLEDSLEDASQD